MYNDIEDVQNDVYIPVYDESGAVYEFSLVSGGSPTYVAGTYDFTGGTGSGFRGTISISPGGTISGVTIVNRGTGYSQYDTLSPSGAGGSMAYIQVNSVVGNSKIDLNEIYAEKSASLLIGNGTSTGFTLKNSGASSPNKNHNLGTDSSTFMIQLVDAGTGDTVYADVRRSTNGDVFINFNSAPASNGIRVLINKLV